MRFLLAASCFFLSFTSWANPRIKQPLIARDDSFLATEPSLAAVLSLQTAAIVTYQAVSETTRVDEGASGESSIKPAVLVISDWSLGCWDHAGVNVVEFFYHGSQVIAIGLKHPSGDVTWTHAIGRGPLGPCFLKDLTGQGNDYFIFTDHLGTPFAWHNPDTGQTTYTPFNPWGELLATPTSGYSPYEHGNVPTSGFNLPTFEVFDVTPLGLAGHIYDEKTGLVYMHHRYLHPRLGHFLTPDFLAPDIYDPSTFTEPYAYAGGNPIMFWDPNGLDWVFFYVEKNDDGWNEHRIIFSDDHQAAAFALHEAYQNELGLQPGAPPSDLRFLSQLVWVPDGNSALDSALSIFKQAMSESYKAGGIRPVLLGESVDWRDQYFQFLASKCGSPMRNFGLQWEQLKRDHVDAFEQMVLGRYSEKTTGLGTGFQVGLGVTGLDVVADSRDLYWDFTHWEWRWGHIGSTALDAVGLVPVIGCLKYGDEASTLLKAARRIDLPVTLRQQAELARITREVRSEMVNNFDVIYRNLKPGEINAIVEEPWRMSLFFGTALEMRVDERVREIVKADPSSVLSELKWTNRGNAPQDFIGPDGFGFDITGGSASSVFRHQNRAGVDAIVTYDSIPSDLGYRFILWLENL